MDSFLAVGEARITIKQAIKVEKVGFLSGTVVLTVMGQRTPPLKVGSTYDMTPLILTLRGGDDD